MPKILTQKEFEKRVISIHGDKYDLSNAVYINNRTKVCLFCKKHGSFEITPRSLFAGCGCYDCGREKTTTGNRVPKKRAEKICGVGINDYKGTITNLKSYYIWHNMIARCYDKTSKMFKYYEDCSVCKEWLLFSNFKRWFDDPENGYKDGYHLDKDILVQGNKVYSPETCCFVPPQINVQIKRNRKSSLPYGVVKNGSRFFANITKRSKTKLLGGFETKEEAFLLFKKERENYIQEITKKYYSDGKITKKVYDALIKYEVKTF